MAIFIGNYDYSSVGRLGCGRSPAIREASLGPGSASHAFLWEV